MSEIGLNRLATDEVDSLTGRVNLKDKTQLMQMLNHFERLLRDKLEIEASATGVHFEAYVALWNERLASLDAKYDIQQFIRAGSVLMPQNHVNANEVNKILDVLAALQCDEIWNSASRTQQTGEYRMGPNFQAALKEAMTRKLNVYKERLNSPTMNEQLRAAFRHKIEQTKLKMQSIKKKEDLDDSIAMPE